MDERMLKTGTVPVADQINMLPSAAKGERKTPFPPPRRPPVCATEANTRFYAVTTGKQPAQEEDEEAELEKLRAEMAMG